MSLVPDDDAALQQAAALNDEVLQLAAQKTYWPEFDPARIPLAIYDGTIEIMGCEALTEGKGPHPLFNGITRIVLTGLSEKPQISYAADRVTVKTPACQAEFGGATLSESDSTVVIRLAGEK